MAGSSSNQDIFDVRKIRRLVELMKEHDLNEIDLRQGEMRIQLLRGINPGGVALGTVGPGGAAAQIAPAVAAPAAVPAQPNQAPVPASPQSGAEPADDPAHIVAIKSPMVGTFYASPDPESAAYVKVGDRVGPETTVCIVEAMKVFNQIPAEVSGKIVSILVEGGDPVEFGQPIFKVDTRN